MHLRGRKGVLFDTSTWSPIDLLDFYRQIPPEQVVYASDYPYGQQPASLLIALKTARLAGYDDDQLRAMLGGTANALADGRELPEPTDAGRRASCSRSRCSSRASTSTSRWRRRSSGRASPTRSACSGLAINACAERNGHVEAVDRIRELLVAARDLWETLPEIEDEVDQRAATRLTFRLIHLADIEAVTTLHERQRTRVRASTCRSARRSPRRCATS